MNQMGLLKIKTIISNNFFKKSLNGDETSEEQICELEVVEIENM